MPPTCDFEYTIIRSPKRRTVSIAVDSGTVTVRAPVKFPERRIREFVESKSSWIEKKLSESRKKASEAPLYTYASGEIFLYQGEPLELEVLPSGRRSSTAIRDGRLVVSLRDGERHDKVPDMIRKWYIARARELFAERCGHLSSRLDVRPLDISIRGQKKRWGSCSSNGRISLNWKLAMAPPEILDYVVVHELCHLLHRNHGPEFWRALGSVMPDYKARRKWLKENGHKLCL